MKVVVVPVVPHVEAPPCGPVLTSAQRLRYGHPAEVPDVVDSCTVLPGSVGLPGIGRRLTTVMRALAERRREFRRIQRGK